MSLATATALPLSPRIESGPSDAVVSYGTPLEKKKPAIQLYYTHTIQRVDVQKQALFCLPLDVETDMPPCRKLNINTQLPTHCFHVTLHGG